MDRAELGALRDAIDTILNWPDSVRDQIAQWLQTDASKPNGADAGRLSRSRSNRPPGLKPGVGESAARERALLVGALKGSWLSARGFDDQTNQLNQWRGDAIAGRTHSGRFVSRTSPANRGFS